MTMHSFEIAMYTGTSNYDLEQAISKNYIQSYYYAIYVLKGRFELGEDVISQNSNYSYRYALSIIQGRWELGENAISQDWDDSIKYALKILKTRFKQGEKIILNLHQEIYCKFILGYNHE